MRVQGTLSADGSAVSATGSRSLSAESLTLRASSVPAGLGGFYFGPKRIATRLGDGICCVGGPIVRMPILESQSGVLEYPVDFPSHGTQLAALGTVHFQAWFRDPADAGAGFNFSNGLEITFLP